MNHLKVRVLGIAWMALVMLGTAGGIAWGVLA